MSYFKAITNSYFKPIEGKEIFYPWGSWGKGYVIPNEEKAIELKRLFKKIAIFSLIYVYFILYMTKAFGLPVGVGFILLFYFIYHISIQTITRHYEKASEKLTFAQSYTNMSYSFSWLNLLLLSLVSLFFVVVGFRIMIQEGGFWIGLSSVAFFGICLGIFIFQVFKKYSNSRRP